MDQIYLDHNATTRIDPRVAQAIFDCHQAGHMNPASSHQFGQRSRRVVESARESLAQLLGADSGIRADQVLFTSGGTESNNLAILGLAGRRPGRVIISAIEHPSVMGPAEQLRRQGFEVDLLPVSSAGVVDLEWLKKLLDPRTRLVSVMLGNNETGVLQPVAEIARLCQEAGVPMHTDAVQVIGKLPVDFRGLGVTSLALAAHKFHGPRGIGALLVRHQTQLAPQLFGGFQQGGLRPGTEPVELIVGLQTALELWRQEQVVRAERMQGLRDQFEQILLAELPDLIIHGRCSPRLPQTSNIAFPGLDRQVLLMALDLAGVACSTGSACSSGSTDPSPVLLAMGLPRQVVDSSLRFSLGAFTTAAEIVESAGRISRIVKDLQRRK